MRNIIFDVSATQSEDSHVHMCASVMKQSSWRVIKATTSPKTPPRFNERLLRKWTYFRALYRRQSRRGTAQHDDKSRDRRISRFKVTCPFLSISLLVSLTFSKETTCFLSWSPVNGESGWGYSLAGAGGSAFPATNHDDLWYAYLYLLLSTGTMSSKTAYRADPDTPENDTLNVGNIRLQYKFNCEKIKMGTYIKNIQYYYSIFNIRQFKYIDNIWI